MICRKCGKKMPDGFDCGIGKYTGAEEGLCIDCFKKRIDRICDTIHNAKGGPLPALLTIECGDISEERKAEIAAGSAPTEEESGEAIERASRSGYLTEVSQYTMEVEP